MKFKYAFFDGDNVGNTIELLLVEGKTVEAQDLSRNINSAIQQITQFLVGRAELILAGGDDVLIKIVDDVNLSDTLKSVMQIFAKNTGLTISCGVDNTISGAIYQLNLAKLYGKNQIKINNKR